VLSPFLEQAKRVVGELNAQVKLETVILDDWCGIRLIYETPEVRQCRGQCPDCRLWRILGEDRTERNDGTLHATLTPSTRGHTDISAYPMLNCKTKDDYAASFVQWLLLRCQTIGDFREELDLIANFRVVYDRSDPSETGMAALERRMKSGIVSSAYRQSSPEHRALIREALSLGGHAALLTVIQETK
jgi:hypothetical protein